MPTSSRATSTKKATKAELQQAARDRIGPRVPEILDAHIAAATGLVHFHARDPLTGEFEVMTDPEAIRKIRTDPVKQEGTHYYISVKDPDVRSAALLLGYAIDTPPKPAEDHTVRVIDDYAAKLAARRKRLHASRSQK